LREKTGETVLPAVRWKNTTEHPKKKGNKGATRILKGQNGKIRDTFYSYVTFFAQFK